MMNVEDLFVLEIYGEERGYLNMIKEGSVVESIKNEYGEFVTREKTK